MNEAVVERFRQESMNSHCREVAISGGSTVILIWKLCDLRMKLFPNGLSTVPSCLCINMTISFNHVPSNWYWIILLNISNKKNTKWWLVALEKRNQGVENACKKKQIRLKFLQYYFHWKIYFCNPLTPVSQLTIL